MPKHDTDAQMIYTQNPFTSSDPRVQLGWLYLIAAFVTLALVLFVPLTFSNDSPGYISAGFVFAQGKLDAIRTPFYPWMCYLSQLCIKGNGAYTLLFCIQQAAFLASIYAFYRIAEQFVRTRALLFSIVLLYICHPGIVSWNRVILTESFAISGTVFLVYLLLRFYRKSGWGTVVGVNLLLLSLVALRPSSIYLFPAVFLLWLYSIWKRKINSWAALCGTFLVIGCIAGYSYLYQREYGIFQPSYVSDLNQYYILRANNLMEPRDTNQPSLQSYLAQCRYRTDHRNGEAYYEEFFFLIDTYGPATVHQLIKSSLSNHAKEYLSVLFTQASDIKNYPAFVSYTEPDFAPAKAIRKLMFFLFSFPFHVVYLFLAGYAIGLCIYMKREKTIPILSLCLWTLVTANVGIAVFGAMGEWHRLFAPGAPVLFILIAQGIDYFCFPKTNSTLREF